MVAGIALQSSFVLGQRLLLPASLPQEICIVQPDVDALWSKRHRLLQIFFGRSRIVEARLDQSAQAKIFRPSLWVGAGNPVQRLPCGSEFGFSLVAFLDSAVNF